MNPRSPEIVRNAFQKIEEVRRRKHNEGIKKARFSILACNCWGAALYAELQVQFQTPFVSLFMHPDCYLGFLENLDEALKAPLEFIPESRYIYSSEVTYPIGLIMGSFEIHFMHYASREQARDRWNRRRERVAPDLKDRYFMMMNMPIYRIPDVPRFLRLPFPNKVLFTDVPLPEAPGAILVPPPVDKFKPEDGLTLYYRTYRYFDLANWINNGGSVC